MAISSPEMMLVPKTRTSSASKKETTDFQREIKIKKTYPGKYHRNFRYQSYDRCDICFRPVNPIVKHIKVNNLQICIGRYVGLNNPSLALFIQGRVKIKGLEFGRKEQKINRAKTKRKLTMVVMSNYRFCYNVYTIL